MSEKIEEGKQTSVFFIYLFYSLLRRERGKADRVGKERKAE